jgi:tetratricopeptide (TPR) repeat protein
MDKNRNDLKANAPRALTAILTSAMVVALLVGCAGDYARKRAEHYYLQGQTLVNRGEVERAIKKFEKSIYLSEKTGFTAGIAHNLNELAIIDTNHGKYDDARAKLDRALTIYRAEEMNPEASKTLNNMVQTYLREGRFEDAVIGYEKLIEWDEKTGNHLGAAIALYNTALIYDRNLKDRKKAVDAYDRSIEIFRETGNEEYLRKLQGWE